MQRISVTHGERIEVVLAAGADPRAFGIDFKVAAVAAVPPPPAPVPNPGPWTPPLGIPEPEFGVREVARARPAPWIAEVPGYYFVDQYASSSEQKYGTPEKPRRTIPALLPAGAVVEVRGNYDHAPTGYSTIDGAGTAESPIFIRAAPGAQPKFRRDIHVVGSFIVLEGLEFCDFDGTLVGQPVLRAPAHHVALRDCWISGNKKKGGALIVSWDAQRAHDLVILRCIIHSCGDVLATTDQDQHGVAIGCADRVWVLDCDISKCSGDGVQVNGGQAGQARTNHIYVGRCRSWGNKQSGIWTKQAVDVVFSQNVVSGHRPGNSSPGAGMGFQYAPERVWFLWNEVADCEMGIYAGSDSGLGTGREAHAVGNKITDCLRTRPAEESGWAPAAMTLAGGLDWSIAANRVERCSGGIYSPNPAAVLRLDANDVKVAAPGKAVLVAGKVINEPLGAKLAARFLATYGITLLTAESAPTPKKVAGAA